MLLCEWCWGSEEVDGQRSNRLVKCSGVEEGVVGGRGERELKMREQKLFLSFSFIIILLYYPSL